MIGPLYVNFVPVCIDSLCPLNGPLCLHTLYIGHHTTVYMHVAKNNTIFTTTCLCIPIHSRNLV